jgi:hypothetical protein
MESAILVGVDGSFEQRVRRRRFAGRAVRRATSRRSLALRSTTC